MATLPVLTPKRARLIDLLKLYYDERYNFEVVAIRNTSAGTIAVGTSLCGLPVRNNAGVWETVQNPNEANISGIVVDDTLTTASIAAAATSTQRWKVLARGPALINASKIATQDVAGGTYVQATVLTRLAAQSPPILVLSEAPSGQKSTQVN